MSILRRVPVDDKPILSAQVSNSDQIFYDISRLYFTPGDRIADLTYGRGVFWRKMDQSLYTVFRSDLAPVSGIQARIDAAHLPYPSESMDVLVFDPPYLYVGGIKTLKDSINRGYRNKERGFTGVDAVDKMYFDFLAEAHRVLRPDGLAICKHMTQVLANLVRPGPIMVYNYAIANGFSLLDWMINVAQSTPTLRWTFQMHSRRNYSDWLIFLKERT